MIKLLNTTVHVESRRRFCKARKISATPASPECVAIRMCSMYLCKSQLFAYWRIVRLDGLYLDFGGAAYGEHMSVDSFSGALGFLRTFIFVAPFTDFSKELAISAQSCRWTFATALLRGDRNPFSQTGRLERTMCMFR